MDNRNILYHGNRVTTQLTRYPKALEDNYALIDDNSFEQQLQRSAELAKHLAFFTDELKQHGNWGTLFTNNIFSLLTEIVSYYPQYSDLPEALQSGSNIQKQARLAYMLANKMNQWLLRCDWCATSVTDRLEVQLNNHIGHQLVTELHTIAALVSQFESTEIINQYYQFNDFAPLWGVNSDDKRAYPLAKKPDKLGSSEATLINHALQAFFAQLYNIRQSIRPLINDALETDGHDPAISLFVTFLKLTEKLKNRINQFTAAHRDYYYFDLLNLSLSEPNQDRVVLHLPLKNNVSFAAIDKSMGFSCKKDKGELTTFSTAANIELNDTTVEELQTIYLQRDPFVSPECYLGFVTKLKRSALNKSQLPFSNGQSMPLFGNKNGNQNYLVNEDIDIGFAVASPCLLLKHGKRNLRVKLSLNQPYLDSSLLKTALSDYSTCSADSMHEVFRVLLQLIHFNTDSDTVSIINNSAAQYHQAFSQLTEVDKREQVKKHVLLSVMEGSDSDNDVYRAFGKLISHNMLCNGKWLTKIDLTRLGAIASKKCHLDIFDTSQNTLNYQQLLPDSNGQRSYTSLLEKVFCVSLTSDHGWLENLPTRLRVKTTRCDTVKLHLDIDISEKALSIIGFNPELHQGTFSTNQPVLKAHLNKVETFYGYSLFEDFNLNNLDISCTVKDTLAVVAFNQYGQVDTGKPFPAFGPIPTASSYLKIGCYEAAKKQVSSFSVNIVWKDLPPGAGGYSSIFSAYGLDVTNRSFLVKSSALIDNVWKATGVSHLFCENDADNSLLPQSTLNLLSSDKTTAIQPRVTENDYNTKQSLRNGFYEIKLIAPDSGFGHSIYPTILTQNLTQRLSQKKPMILPPAPISPMVEKLTVSYSASEQIDLAQPAPSSKTSSKYFHCIDHQGIELSNAKDRLNTPLMPSFHHTGNLLIGFKANTKPAQVSLYFDLNNDSGLTVNGHKAILTWWAYTLTGWIKLGNNSVISDSTDHLSIAGVIRFELPAELAIDDNQSPDDCFWIKVTNNHACEHFPTINRVLTNCIEVSASGRTSLSTLTNNDFLTDTALPQVKSMKAVFHQQTATALLTNRQSISSTSEYLRHKDRLVTPWDFERIVLSSFPEIYMAKCFAHSAFQTLNAQPGKVLIVVLPHLPEGSNASDSITVSSNLLKRIHKHLSAKSANGLEIEVSNPRYERVQVRCSVKFNSNISSGLHVKQLNSAISDYFNPWENYRENTGFDWRLGCEDLHSYIEHLEYVDYVTGLSIVHIYPRHEHYHVLHDTAGSSSSEPEKIRSHFPWCLPLPDKQHAIKVIDDFKQRPPILLGINEMEVGSNFILGA